MVSRQGRFSSSLAQSKELYLCSRAPGIKTEHLWPHAYGKNRIQGQEKQLTVTWIKTQTTWEQIQLRGWFHRRASHGVMIRGQEIHCANAPLRPRKRNQDSDLTVALVLDKNKSTIQPKSCIGQAHVNGLVTGKSANRKPNPAHAHRKQKQKLRIWGRWLKQDGRHHGGQIRRNEIRTGDTSDWLR
jgi:hypothetical protein